MCGFARIERAFCAHASAHHIHHNICAHPVPVPRTRFAEQGSPNEVRQTRFAEQGVPNEIRLTRSATPPQTYAHPARMHLHTTCVTTYVHTQCRFAERGSPNEVSRTRLAKRSLHPKHMHIQRASDRAARAQTAYHMRTPTRFD